MTKSALTFRMRPRPPFRLDFTVWALRRRGRNLIDCWDGSLYRRVLVLDGVPVPVSLGQIGSSERPSLLVNANAPPNLHSGLTKSLTRMLGLHVDLNPFYAMAMRDRRLAPLVEQFRGVKPPRFPTVFEGFVNAVACQQLSLTVGIELLNRLATQFGLSPETDVSQHAFPRPEDVVHIDPNRFRQLGLSHNKARSILELANLIVSGHFDAGALEKANNSVAQEQLCGLRGVGRWTAEYVLLRGLGRIDVFPGDDVGARNRLATWLRRREELNYQTVERIVAPWRPYAGLVYFHLLLAGLAESGDLSHADAAQRSA